MRLPSLRRSSWGVIGIAPIVGAIALVWIYWDWSALEPDGMESRSATLRDVVLTLSGPIAIVTASWRNVISNRCLLNERCQKGAEMLGCKILSVRLAAVYALERWARGCFQTNHARFWDYRK